MNDRSICRIPNQEIQLQLPKGKKIYFLSDTHLGAPILKNHRERELQLVSWMDSIRPDCGILCMLGDIFDFWFEYKRVVPKGFVRFLSKICEFTESTPISKIKIYAVFHKTERQALIHLFF